MHEAPHLSYDVSMHLYTVVGTKRGTWPHCGAVADSLPYVPRPLPAMMGCSPPLHAHPFSAAPCAAHSYHDGTSPYGHPKRITAPTDARRGRDRVSLPASHFALVPAAVSASAGPVVVCAALTRPRPPLRYVSRHHDGMPVRNAPSSYQLADPLRAEGRYADKAE